MSEQQERVRESFGEGKPGSRAEATTELLGRTYIWLRCRSGPQENCEELMARDAWSDEYLLGSSGNRRCRFFNRVEDAQGLGYAH
jgi:hypothetical protein